ncbi:NAD(P)H-quinone oxidoreductase [Aquabacter cavernae]|uniref:NAD(P)H-quinone oxidoreductase n=1 Tax=Aquabacter cavernae TaxID=2496029 RepID=UPI000F8DCABD|nr:NAD(P)H-quinone oxidoreductase [Aquabacter cavernae]
MTALPETMTAITIPVPGGPEALVPGERPVPRPGPGEILVQVAAAGVNRPDVVQRRGLYPPPPGASDIPGLEIAGTVVALGEGATRYMIGDRVCALVTGGGYAQYCPTPEATALPVPEGLGLLEAAAIPETFFTVWSNVFDRARLAPGETLLVHGGAGGIGTTAILLGKAFGARVLTTAGGPEKCAACLTLGADVAIDYKTQDFVAEVKAATGGKGADVILDVIGGSYIQRNFEAAATDGRIAQIAFQDGSKAQVDFMRLMLKRLTHTGATLRSRPLKDKAAIARALEEKVWPFLAAGTLRPLMDRTFPLTDAAGAHARMEASAHMGKIVLEVA